MNGLKTRLEYIKQDRRNLMAEARIVQGLLKTLPVEVTEEVRTCFVVGPALPGYWVYLFAPNPAVAIRAHFKGMWKRVVSSLSGATSLEQTIHLSDKYSGSELIVTITGADLAPGCILTPYTEIVTRYKVECEEGEVLKEEAR